MFFHIYGCGDSKAMISNKDQDMQYNQFPGFVKQNSRKRKTGKTTNKPQQIEDKLERPSAQTDLLFI